jgi:hypothetical protein
MSPSRDQGELYGPGVPVQQLYPDPECWFACGDLIWLGHKERKFWEVYLNLDLKNKGK